MLPDHQHLTEARELFDLPCPSLAVCSLNFFFSLVVVVGLQKPLRCISQIPWHCRSPRMESGTKRTSPLSWTAVLSSVSSQTKRRLSDKQELQVDRNKTGSWNSHMSEWLIYDRGLRCRGCFGECLLVPGSAPGPLVFDDSSCYKGTRHAFDWAKSGVRRPLCLLRSLFYSE